MRGRSDVDSYAVTYRYDVEGQTFQGIDVIPVTPTNQKLLNWILEGEASVGCVVKFDVDDPGRSLLTVRK